MTEQYKPRNIETCSNCDREDHRMSMRVATGHGFDRVCEHCLREFLKNGEWPTEGWWFNETY